HRPAGLVPDGEQGDPAFGRLGDRADELLDLLLRRARLERPGQMRGLLGTEPLETAELLRGQARLELRDDVEVDERDRTGCDQRGREHEPVAEAVDARV